MNKPCALPVFILGLAVSGLAYAQNNQPQARDSPPTSNVSQSTADTGAEQESEGGDPSFTIDFVTLGAPVNGMLRRRLDDFKREVIGDEIRFTGSEFSLEDKRLIKFDIATTRATDTATPRVFDVSRSVVISGKGFSPDTLMDSVKDRHGGAPSCQRIETESDLTAGMKVAIKAIAGKSDFTLDDDWRSDTPGSHVADVCLWGDAELADGASVACSGSCLMAMVLYPVESANILRLDEKAFSPGLAP